MRAGKRSVCSDPIALYGVPVHFDRAFKNAAVGKDDFFACGVCLIAGQKELSDSALFGVPDIQTEHLLRIALPAFGRSYGIPAVTSPCAENRVVDMVAQVDHTHEPAIAFPDGKIGRRRHRCSRLFTGFRMLPQVAERDPFPRGPALPQTRAARKLIRIAVVAAQDLVLELLQLLRVFNVCLGQKQHVSSPSGFSSTAV